MECLDVANMTLQYQEGVKRESRDGGKERQGEREGEEEMKEGREGGREKRKKVAGAYLHLQNLASDR